jgi:hypothetical protein
MWKVKLCGKVTIARWTVAFWRSASTWTDSSVLAELNKSSEPRTQIRI